MREHRLNAIECVATRHAVRLVFVSTGHCVSLQTVVKLVLELAPHNRLPEPIRLADRLSRLHP